MSMEVMAAEFPDIYQQFLDPQPSPSGPGEDVRSVGVDWNMFTSNMSGSKDIVQDANKNTTIKISSEHSNRNVTKFHTVPTVPTSQESFLSTNLVTNLTSAASTNSVNSLSGYVLTTNIQSGDYIKKASDDGNVTEVDSDLMLSEFADLDDILATLEQLDTNPSSNSQLDLTKSAYGCQWSDSSTCLHGDSCPFITQFLGLAEFPEPADVTSSRMHSVVVLRQTPQGLVKLQESLLPLGQEEVRRLQAMTPQEQVRHLGLNTAQLRQENLQLNISQQTGITTSPSTLQSREQGREIVKPTSTGQYTMTPSITPYTVPMSNNYPTTSSYNTEHFIVPATASQGQYSTVSSSDIQYTTYSTSNIKFRSSGAVSYRPPPNAVLVKVPTAVLQNQNQSYQFNKPSPSPPTISPLSVTSPPNTKVPLLCADCDTQFHDSKSLVKHTRNQHQTYHCNKCGEETVGYYRMASHTKKNHSKEPAFFCQCGRNFSEKRGMTKHQNSCSFYTTH